MFSEGQEILLLCEPLEGRRVCFQYIVGVADASGGVCTRRWGGSTMLKKIQVATGPLVAVWRCDSFPRQPIMRPRRSYFPQISKGSIRGGKLVSKFWKKNGPSSFNLQVVPTFLCRWITDSQNRISRDPGEARHRKSRQWRGRGGRWVRLRMQFAVIVKEIKNHPEIFIENITDCHSWSPFLTRGS